MQQVRFLLARYVYMMYVPSYRNFLLLLLLHFQSQPLLHQLVMLSLLHLLARYVYVMYVPTYRNLLLLLLHSQSQPLLHQLVMLMLSLHLIK
jgi:hypothetical protein